MGIVLKRRDNAQIVKKIYGGVINIILEKQDLEGSIEFLQEELSDLVEGKTSIKDLVITKSLRATYKDPTKIAHKVLADRIGARDPGNRPVVNERIPFVYIKTDSNNGSVSGGNKAPSLQGDRIENPDYIVQNNLIPDYLHYITNQIMKPILQLYALCLDRLPGYDKDDEYWEDVEKGLLEKPLYKVDIKRKNRINNLKLMMAKELLFDKFINILSEPKAPTVRKSRKTIAGAAGEADTVKVPKVPKTTKAKTGKTATEENEISVDAVLPTNMDATIRITKKKQTNIIESVAYINNEKKKKIWEVKKDNCKNKDIEIIELVKQIVEYDSNKIYFITLNNKGFKEEYNRAHYKYKDLLKNHSEDSVHNIINDVMNSTDIGMLTDINNIRRYYELILINSKFMFV
jgi:hypothetical protein